MADLSGQTIGRYHLLEPLGKGGMAVVYKAFDNRLEREVAIKLIRMDAFPAESHARILARFEREAKILARLDHPHIVQVHDYGGHNGAPYVVMPLLAGGTLKARTGLPLPWQQAVQLVRPIAAALAYAHSQGVLHRDIKPANILVTREGRPVLTDFGIARLLDGESGQTLTGTGVGVGTPEYMAPEQGLGGTVDGRADVYALGVVLYELLTGQKPYSADTPLAVMLKQVHDPLPDPRQYAPDLPKAVEQVLLKALAKQPEDRYEDMGSLAAALVQLVDDEQDYGLPDLPAAATMFPERETRDELLLESHHPGSGGTVPASRLPRWVPWLAGTVLIAGCSGLLALGLLLSGGIIKPEFNGLDEGITVAVSNGSLEDPAVSHDPVLEEGSLAGAPAGGANPAVGVTETALSAVPTSLPTSLPFNPYGWKQGRLVFTARLSGGGAELILMDLVSSEQITLQTALTENYLLGPALSPDGSFVAYYTYPDDLYRVPLEPGVTAEHIGQCQSPSWSLNGGGIVCRAGGNVLRWLDGPTVPGITGLIPALFPNGHDLAYAVVEDGDTKIYRTTVEGTGTVLLAGIASENFAPVVSPDSAWIAYQSNDGSEVSEIWRMTSEGSSKERLTFSGGSWSRGPSWSPDGNWLAFVSSQAGSIGADFGEVFILSLESGESWQITDTGGRVYDWRVSWGP